MKVYFAPLEGITGYIFRNVYEEYYGGIDRYFTPFIATTQKTRLRNKELRDILPENNKKIPLVPQIMSNHAEDFIYTAEFIAALGYDTVNLNLGCPSRTVVSKGKGAGFLAKTVALDRFLDQIYSKCSMRISIKTRLGRDDPEEFYELMRIYNQYPVEELIIHPRVQTDFYKNTPNLEMFAKAVETCRMPVCYNGDLFSMEDYHRLCRQFPAIDRVMLGRGLLSHPELAGQIQKEQRKPDWGLAEQSHEEQRKPDWELLHQYTDALCRAYSDAYSGDQPVLFKMKELWGFLADSMPEGDRLRKRIHKVQRLDGYQRIMSEIFCGGGSV